MEGKLEEYQAAFSAADTTGDGLLGVDALLNPLQPPDVCQGDRAFMRNYWSCVNCFTSRGMYDSVHDTDAMCPTCSKPWEYHF